MRQFATTFVICGELLYRRSPRWPIVVMSRPCLCRSSDERGSCKSLWATHERTHVGPKDYEDRLFLIDHGGKLLSVHSELPRVLDAQ